MIGTEPIHRDKIAYLPRQHCRHNIEQPSRLNSTMIQGFTKSKLKILAFEVCRFAGLTHIYSFPCFNGRSVIRMRCYAERRWTNFHCMLSVTFSDYLKYEITIVGVGTFSFTMDRPNYVQVLHCSRMMRQDGNSNMNLMKNSRNNNHRLKKCYGRILSKVCSSFHINFSQSIPEMERLNVSRKKVQKNVLQTDEKQR